MQTTKLQWDILSHLKAVKKPKSLSHVSMSGSSGETEVLIARWSDEQRSDRFSKSKLDSPHSHPRPMTKEGDHCKTDFNVSQSKSIAVRIKLILASFLVLVFMVRICGGFLGKKSGHHDRRVPFAFQSSKLYVLIEEGLSDIWFNWII